MRVTACVCVVGWVNMTCGVGDGWMGRVLRVVKRMLRLTEDCKRSEVL